MTEEIEIVVNSSSAGLRLDVFVSREIESCSRREAQRLIDGGEILVNGHPGRKGRSVEAGDVIRLSGAAQAGDRGAAPDESISVEVAYDDPDFLVVHKPAGMDAHPLRADERGTLANGLIASFPELSGVGYGPLQPGLVNRLDRDTSGLMLVARNAESFSALRDELKAGRMRKSYICACEGWVDAPRLIDWYLTNHPRDRRKVMACRSEIEAQRLGGRPAETLVHESRAVEGGSLLRVEAKSAFRHQIRVHLAAIGHPLWGDTLYGGEPRQGLQGQFLHAADVEFSHPKDGSRIFVKTDLPEKLQALLK